MSLPVDCQSQIDIPLLGLYLKMEGHYRRERVYLCEMQKVWKFYERYTIEEKKNLEILNNN